MMEKQYLSFNDLIETTGLGLKNFKYYRHVEKSNPNDRAYNLFQKWSARDPYFIEYQNTQSGEDIFHKQFLASCIKILSGETVFVGIYEKLGSRKEDGCYIYDFKETNYLKYLCGRVVIDWPEGSGARRSDRRPENCKSNVILIKSKEEKDFPGYFEFKEQVDKVKTLPKSWIQYLSEANGIYLLTCTKSRKHQYVGKASGNEGFFGRWCNYDKPEEGEGGDGGNKLLIEHNKSGCGIFEVTILEMTSWSDPKIYEKEQTWMRKLRTKQDSGGLNAN